MLFRTECDYDIKIYRRKKKQLSSENGEHLSPVLFLHRHRNLNRKKELGMTE